MMKCAVMRAGAVSSLLTSLLAENNGGGVTFEVLLQSVKEDRFKDETTAECLSFYVPTLKHEVEQQLLTRKHKLLFNFVF